jgi:ketosteroid isomerase-like protein
MRAIVELEERNREIVRALYKATGHGNWTAAAALLSEDVLITEPGTLPFAGTYRGVDAMRELFEKVVRTAGVIGAERKQITAGGDWVVVLHDLLLEGPPPVRAPLAEAFRLRDGKVCEIIPYYFDHRLITAAAEARKR